MVTIKELSNWEQWQLEKYGNILPLPNLQIAEPGEAEARRFNEWSHLQQERLLHEFDDQYTNTRH